MEHDLGDPVDEMNRSLNSHERNTIRANLHCFKRLLKPYENDFLDHLLENECITGSQYNHIISKELTQDEMISKLFETLMRRSFFHYQLFIKFLVITHQKNLANILIYDGIVLTLHAKFERSGTDEYVTDIITRAVEIDTLDIKPEIREIINERIWELEGKGIYIVGCSSTGSPIIYLLCLKIDSFNELERMFHDGQLKKDINTLLQYAVACEYSLDVEIDIHHKEF